MNRNHDTRVGAAVALLFAVGAVVMAQGPAGVDVTLEPPLLSRGRTAVATVTVRIPDGLFIPAETRGNVIGAWLDVAGDGIEARERPTFPSADEARLPGSPAAVLAYRGTIHIRLPLAVPAGLIGRRTIAVRFGYQACDAVTCDFFQTIDASADVVVREPAPTDGSIAFRVDDSRVAILIDKQSSADRALPYMPMQARGLTFTVLPPGHRALTEFDTSNGSASRWLVGSDGPAFTALGEQPAALGVACQDTMPLTVIARVADRSFVRDSAKYFLATRATDSTRSTQPLRSLAVELHLDTAMRQALEQVIDRQLRITLPSLFAPRLEEFGQEPLSETSDDMRVRSGEGRLVYHLEAFKLAPDDDPRLYVRAHWAVDGRSQTGLTLWIRFDGQHFLVERSDASVTTMARFEETRIGPAVASDPSFAGMLLNVIPANDGWAYLIVERGAYKFRGIAIWKYTVNGPVDTGIRWGARC